MSSFDRDPSAPVRDRKHGDTKLTTAPLFAPYGFGDSNGLNSYYEVLFRSQGSGSVKRRKSVPKVDASNPKDDSKKDSVDGEDEEEEGGAELGAFDVFRFADKTDRTLLWVGGIGAFCAGAGIPAFSWIFGDVVNTIFFEEDVAGVLATLATYFVYVGIGMMFFSALQVGCYMVSAHRQVARIKLLYFKALLRQDIAWTDEHKPGELTSRMDGDTTVLRNSINDKLSAGIQSLGTFIFGFALGFYKSWELTLIMLGALPLISIVTMILGKVMINMTRQSRDGYAVAGAIALEVFDNIKTVKTFNGEEREVARFKAAAEPAVGFGIKKDFAGCLAAGTVMCIMFCVYAIAFWFSSYLIEWGRRDVGEILAAFFATLMGSFALGLMFPSINAFLEGRAAAKRIFHTIARTPPIDVYESDSEIDIDDVDSHHAAVAASMLSPITKNLQDGDVVKAPETTPIPVDTNTQNRKKKKASPTFRNCIELKDVSFSYPTRRDFRLFHDLNLSIHQGESIAFSGTSGCGKSSIVQLLQRFYDVDSGSVLIDGEDIRKFSVRGWRDQIGVVSQEPTLFTGSILSNVLVGKPDATLEEVHIACQAAQIHDLIMGLPNKYETIIGGGSGTSLSGGQKQRLAIARAIIKSPSLLLLDEATSALDRTSEMEVQAALENISKISNHRLTVVTIAHRLATIQHCDRIYFLDHDDLKGSWVAESGTYAELLALDGAFAAMTRRQHVSQLIAAEKDKEFEEKQQHQVVTGDEPTTFPQPAAASNEPSTHVVELSHTSETPPPRAATAAPPPATVTAAASASPDGVDPPELKRMTDTDISTSMPSPYGRVFGMLRPNFWAVSLGILGSMIQGLIYPAYAVIFTQMLNVLGTYAFDGPGLRRETPLWAGLFIAIGFTSLFAWVMCGFYTVAGERLTLLLRVRLFTSMLRQDMTFFDTPGRDAGALSGMLSADTEMVHALWGPALGTKVQMGANLCGGLVIAFIYSWRVALVTLSAMPLLIATTMIQKILIARRDPEKEVADGGSEATVKSESLSNVRTVAAFNMQKRCVQQYRASVELDGVNDTRNGIIMGVIFGITQFSNFGLMALAYWYGGRLIQEGKADFLDVSVAAMTIMMAGMGVGEVGGFATKYNDANIASKRVFYVMDRVPVIDSCGGGKTPNCNGSTVQEDGATVANSFGVDFDEVRFRYPSRPSARVLQSVSLEIEGGKSYGVMGSTGCGKSTVLQLLARFYDPLQGRVLVGTDSDKDDLRDVQVAQWRDNLAIVLQEPSLFSGTVLENIRYGVQTATREEVEQVAKYAQIHDDIMRMPNGYETQVGYKGQSLSGGQKQRAAIARALLRRPRLLLLDEATSALDNATESMVQHAIYTLSQEQSMGVVAIAHRLTTIQASDTILVMHEGLIIESGSHDALMALNGEYSHKWKSYMGEK